METDKIIVIDTCALLPNCQKEDKRFDINKWTNFLSDNKEYELYITPFTLYEILTLTDEPTKIELFEYLEKENIKVLTYRDFNGGLLNFSMTNDKSLLIHLRQLIIFECNELLEKFSLNCILLNYGVNKIDEIIDDLNDFTYLNKKAGQVSDLKTWIDDDYFTEYFIRVTNSLEKNLNVKISYDEFINSCCIRNKYLYEISPCITVKREELLISRYILNMALKRQTKHKLINYVIDALNIHAALLENLNAYFITRDKESIKFFKSIEGIGFDIEDKKKFLNHFLITKK